MKWQWTQEKQSSFERLKAALSTNTTLEYFDPKKPTFIFVDGSPVGLGAILTQEESTKEVTPLHYASCPLTPTQARYSQIDREARSIYWAIKRILQGVQGVQVITDHKPLVALFNNPCSKPSARIERWLMKLQQYRFTVKLIALVPQKPADYAHLRRDTQLDMRIRISQLWSRVWGAHFVCCKKCCSESSNIDWDSVCYRKGPRASSCHVGRLSFL